MFEIFYEGKRKLKEKKLGFTVHRHKFKAEINDFEGSVEFYVDEPDFYNVKLDSKHYRYDGQTLAMLGIAILKNQEFIRKTVKKEMNEERKKGKRGENNNE